MPTQDESPTAAAPEPSAAGGDGVAAERAVAGTEAGAALAAGPAGDAAVAGGAARDIAEVPAVEVVLTVALHLMSAAAIACGLADEDETGPAPEPDLAEARILITALGGLVNAAAPVIGSMHAAPLRDGLAALQAAFREASVVPDAPGHGPGEH